MELIKANKRIFLYSIISIFLIWAFIFNFININQVSINRNIFTGSLKIDTVAGFKFSPPWVQVSRIEKRPMMVCIDCDCKNINCKLVSFNYKNWKDFVDKEGFKYYWWSNRISFNIGNKYEYRGLKNILRGYSFDEKTHTFLNIDKQIQ